MHCMCQGSSTSAGLLDCGNELPKANNSSSAVTQQHTGAHKCVKPDDFHPRLCEFGDTLPSTSFERGPDVFVVCEHIFCVTVR